MTSTLNTGHIFLAFTQCFAFYAATITAETCRIDGPLLGTYKRQTKPIVVPNFDHNFAQPLLYETITISASSISDYGECYEKTRNSYIFGQKRMGRPLCFRCITAILRTPNVVQLGHQNGEQCHDSVDEARKTCFDATSINPIEGSFLFSLKFQLTSSENLDFASCELDGRYSITYHLRTTNLTCDGGNESKAENCNVAARIDVKFRGCSFPDFDMSLRCLGSWTGLNGEKYLIVENIDNEEYRCGVLHSSSGHITVHFSNDSSCAHLNKHNAFETYRLTPTSLSKPLSPCQFPEWLRGQYNSLEVTADQLQYNQGTSDSIPIVSYCIGLHGEKILVYSESKCGDPMGYHCLWFRMRSDSVLEFRTTNPLEILNSSLCRDESLLASAPWTSVSVKRPLPVNCGIEGKYRTPTDMQTEDCYSLEAECGKSDSLRLKAYHCASGTVFDARSYSCLASWHDGPFMYLYARRSGDEQVHACFVTQRLNGRLFIASSGAHCSRDFTFEDNVNTTLVMEQEANCELSPQLVVPSAGGVDHPARRPVVKTFPQVSLHPTTESTITGDVLANSAVHGARIYNGIPPSVSPPLQPSLNDRRLSSGPSIDSISTTAPPFDWPSASASYLPSIMLLIATLATLIVIL